MTYEERKAWLMGLGYPTPVASLPSEELAGEFTTEELLMLVLKGLLSIGDVPNG